MPARPIIIDCDPGQDDAVNLLLAFASPAEIDVLGVTTVAGNVPLALTERNARLVCDIAARTDIQVFAGCAHPMHQPLQTAENIHGSTGLDGVPITEPKTPLQSQHAVEYIIETLRVAEPASITLVPTGPLTNLGHAFEKEPAILANVAEIVVMGGAMREGGNHTPSAEFNILNDPHAADIVFQCGRPIVAMGLDVTHKVLGTAARRDRIRALGNQAATATANMLDFFDRYDTAKYGSAGAPLHDPCTVAYLLAPELFSGKQCNISIETESELTMGHTAVDFWHVTDKPRNATWIHDIDADGFFTLLTERLERYGNG